MKKKSKPTCNACHSTDVRHVFVAKDLASGKHKEFGFSKCGKCGLIFQWPPVPLSDLKKHYPSDYEEYKYDHKGVGRAETEELEQFKMALLLSQRKSGKVLDVGCGEALFLELCKQHGFDAHGCDMLSSKQMELAKKKKIDIKNGDFMTLKYPARSFDVITMWHSLEHMPDPSAAMKKVATLLKKGGVVLVAVPNGDSLQADVFKHKWAHVDAPRHFYLFSPKSLDAIFEKSGLKKPHIRHMVYPYNLWGYAASLLNMLGLRRSVNRKTPRYAVLLGTVAFAAPVVIESMLGKGGTVVASSQLK